MAGNKNIEKVRLRQLRDTSANFTSINPTILPGEFVVVSDLKRLKIGTGDPFLNTEYFIQMNKWNKDAVEINDSNIKPTGYTGKSTEDYIHIFGDIVYPITTSDAVKFKNGDSVQTKIDNLHDYYKEDIVNWSPNTLISKMGPGWNLSNTMESWHTGYTTEDPLYWEQLWGSPITTQKIIQAVKSKGYNTIRIPVTWRCNLNPDSTIMESWINRIKTIVNYVLNCNMFCIINVHHDTGPEGNITAEFSKVYEMMYNLENLWKQIALKFADYDYRLIFEGFNEILNPLATNLWYGDEDSYKAVNMLNQSFVNTVRNIKGNENRFLLCSPYGAQYQAGPISAFKLPDDTVKNKLIARLNMYHTDNSHVLETVYQIEKNLISKGIPCIVTEMGILDSTETMIESDRVALTLFQTKQFVKMGLGCIMWDGKLNRETLVWEHNTEVQTFINYNSTTKKESNILNKGFNVMDINNYRGGEYSFTSGIYYKNTTKVSFNNYLVPVYSKYVVTTSVTGLVYLITQLDENYNFIEAEIRGNYGSFDVNGKTRYLGITLYNDTTPYTLADFKELLKTNSLSIVPHDDAIEIHQEELFYRKSDVPEWTKSKLKPTYTADEIGAASKPLIIKNISIPTSAWNNATKHFVYVNSSITVNHSPDVRFSKLSLDIASKANIICYTENGSLTLEYANMPTDELLIDVIILTLV